MTDEQQRVIVLIDMDCFYCQVESRLDSDLRGKPSAVVQYNAWKGGGIIAVNYEARAFGVTRNMRGDEAKAKCPEIILVKVPEVRGKADLNKYRDAGKEVMQVLLQYQGATVERASVDEAYLDITKLVEERQHKTVTAEQLPNTFVGGHEDDLQGWMDLCSPDDFRLAIGAAIVEEMREQVYVQTQFRCSAGIARNKVLAKLACGIHKPNMQTVLPQDHVADLFSTLRVGKLRGLGGKLGEAVVEQLHCQTMGDVAKLGLAEIRRSFDEKTTTWLYNLARGLDHEAVKERDLPKSIGCGKNFRGPEMLDTRDKVEKWMASLATELSERLVKDKADNSRVAKTLHVHVAMDNGNHMSRSGPLFSYDRDKIAQQALMLIGKANEATDKTSWKPKLCNLSVSMSKFEDSTAASTSVQSIANFFGKTKDNDESCDKVCAEELVPNLSEYDPDILQMLPENLKRQVESRVEQLQAEYSSVVESRAESCSDDQEEDWNKCDKCGQSISPFELPEHLDFHVAQELQQEMRQADRQQQTTTAAKKTSKRASSRHDESASKKQKTIVNFFNKK